MAGRVERVIITGASRGIGLATAKLLSGQGAKVAGIARTADLGVIGPMGAALALDLSVAADAERAIGAAEEAIGPCDALVLAAGVAEHAPITDVDAARIEKHFALNVRAPLLLCRDFARRLEARDAKGTIVLVASTLGIAPARHTSVYAATKGAVIAMTKALAVELAPRVRVNAVAPGVIDTEMTRAPRLRRGESMPTGEALKKRQQEQMDALALLHPLGRVGHAEEVAESIAYLLTAEFATGTVLVLDGGLTAGG